MIIGITGGSGSGKTTLLKLLQEKGALIMDCDRIYHGLLQTDTAMLQALQTRFPQAFEAGALQRKKLGEQVFSDPEALKDLNAITHSAVKQAVMERLKEEPALAVIDAIALHEGGLAQLCDLTVAVTATEENRVKRLMTRDGISERYARSRIQAQKSNEAFSATCDHTLENNGTQQEFTDKCLAFCHKIGII